MMAIGSGVSERFRYALVVSGGSEIMVQVFGRLTWAFLSFVGFVLAVLAYASWRLRPWAWHLTLMVYGIGVIGSLWQVSVGIREAWVAALDLQSRRLTGDALRLDENVRESGPGYFRNDWRCIIKSYADPR